MADIISQVHPRKMAEAKWRFKELQQWLGRSNKCKFEIIQPKENIKIHKTNT